MFPQHAEQQAESKKLQEALARQTTANEELEASTARLQLLLLEKEALAKDLERRLGEAILEVVRAKAKLRSLESKAEAVSTLAEAEIALKTLKNNLPGTDRNPDVLQAETLLRASGSELKKENYGGALYLATQAKTIINESQVRSQGRNAAPLLSGEVPFAMPVPLRLVGSSNIRQGPGLDSKVLSTLQDGAALVGYSYKGLWVRVRNEDIHDGWVYYTLIAGR